MVLCHRYDILTLLQRLSHSRCPVLAACPCCHVLAILYSVSFPSCTISTVFSGCPVLSLLSCPGCTGTLPGVLFHRTCPLFTCPYIRCLAAMFWHSVLSVLSWLTCQADLSRLICLGFLVRCSSQCHVPDVIPHSLVSCLSCHQILSVVLSQLPCRSVISGHPVLFFLYCLHHLDCLLWLFCPGFPVPAVLPQYSCS